MTTDREHIGQAPNPMGIEGLEFVEFATAKPQALGQSLEAMGFRPVARHRSREVLLYRQGGMNVVVNAHHADADAPPAISAFGLRVRDAAAAHARAVSRGAWPVLEPTSFHARERARARAPERCNEQQYSAQTGSAERAHGTSYQRSPATTLPWLRSSPIERCPPPS